MELFGVGELMIVVYWVLITPSELVPLHLNKKHVVELIGVR